ncbi:hypothetical protein [Peptostreptococcus sp.]
MANENIEIKKSNVLMIYFEANTFKKEFNRKVREYRSQEYSNNVKDELAIPYCITLASFACELFLKFLIGVNQIKNMKSAEKVEVPRKHNLESLYIQLPSEFKDAILKKIPKDRLEEILERNSNSFMDWRYIYECSKEEIIFNYDYIKQLIDVLYEFANKVKDDICFEANKSTKLEMKGTE